MEVRVYSGVSEISVVYKVDEFSIELFVHLPMSYPLQPPVIREGKRIKIDQAQWRKWLLQFNIFVTNQVRKMHVYRRAYPPCLFDEGDITLPLPQL